MRKQLESGKAVVFDSYYKHFTKNDYESFWNIMDKRIDPVSVEFKSLINLLLSFDPSQRPSMTEIKSHPWCSGEVASENEIVQEFEKRKLTVIQMRKIEAAEEMNKKMKKKPGGVYKSEEDESSTEPLITGERKFENYKEKKINPYKILITGKKNCVSVMNYISDYFKKNNENNNIEIDEEYAKMRLTIAEDIEFKENYPEIEVEKLIIETIISKCDEGWIVEFEKISGDKFEFYNHYDMLINNVKA